ncbi:hypothetical protein D9M71_510730 [compost metagenome]
MKTLTLGHQLRKQRRAHRATEVTQHRDQRRGRARLGLVQAFDRQHRERHHDQRLADTAHHGRGDDHVGGGIVRQVRPQPAAQGHDREATGDQQFSVEPAHQPRQQRRQQQLDHAVGDQADADLAGVVTLHQRQVVGHQKYQAERRRAKHCHGQAGDAKVVAGQQTQVDERAIPP